MSGTWAEAPPLTQSHESSRELHWARRIAGRVAHSTLLRRGAMLSESNRQNYHLPLSRWDKLLTGSYLLLRDYSTGAFPPRGADQAAAYQAEIDAATTAPGVALEQLNDAAQRKPFLDPAETRKHLGDFVELRQTLHDLGVRPAAPVLELGCGTGWAAEFLALTGYTVVGTSLDPREIALAQVRAQAFAARGLSNSLSFRVSPMESVDADPELRGRFQAVFVYEALHHAFDWRATLRAAHGCLAPGGWLIIANEPNVLHTLISYRVATILGTHEIGLSQTALVRTLADIGYEPLRILRPRFNNLVSYHWIAARK